MSELDTALERLVTVNLGGRPGERLVVVTDTAPFAAPTPELPDRPTLAERIAAAARAAGLEARVVTYPPPGAPGVEPPREVFAAVYPEGFLAFLDAEGLWTPLAEKRIDAAGLQRIRAWLAERPPACEIVLAVSRDSVTHTRFRRLLTETGRVRAATMPGVEPRMFTGVMTADWPRVAARSEAVARLLSAAEAAIVRTGDAELRFGLAGRMGIADTGILAEPGAFGNLPGGEAFVAPVEGTATGEVLLGPPTAPRSQRMRFAAGELVDFTGDERIAARLAEVCARHPAARNLAELGVGTNERASDPVNVLEAEKILGTLHLALGDNASFGGTVAVPFHQDFVVWEPTLLLEIEGRPVTILDRGELRVEPT